MRDVGGISVCAAMHLFNSILRWRKKMIETLECLTQNFN